MDMFCYQCEQTAKGTGCTKSGVCGKDARVAALQDLLVYILKGLAMGAIAGRRLGVADRDVNVFTVRALFSTLTNVNFDPTRFVSLIRQAVELRSGLVEKIKKAGGTLDLARPELTFKPAEKIEDLIAQGEGVGHEPSSNKSKDTSSLKHTLLFGIKGIAAYADHAGILGKEDESVYAFIHEALAATVDEKLDLEAALKWVLRCGTVNLRAMELLDAGHTETYGHPVPTKVPLGAKRGKAILVSGHDLKDLEGLLRQTEGKGINIYTHGEMLPAHGYPGLKKYKHLYGHYGTAWQNQTKEFPAFPGAILMTTNCIQKPQPPVAEKLFTSGMAGWPDIGHISDDNFTPLIEKALEGPGFPADTDGGSVTAGFGRNAVLSAADRIIEAVRGNRIRHFFLVAGCDGARPGRNYYTKFVEQVPKDCVVLTLACGKFRFFAQDLGDIAGIPRLLDMGQCNDAYSAIQVALALSRAFKVGINELPLSMVLSWYEQKAVAILLTLLALGIRNIRLGPSLPAFLSPNVLDILVRDYNIRPITTPEEDLKAILG